MANNVKFLGTTDDHTSCDCCGRSDLKSTVALYLDGVVVYFGVVCAARALGLAAADVRRRTKEADDDAFDAAEAGRALRQRAENEAWFAWLREASPAPVFDWTGKLSVIDTIDTLGGYAAAKAAYRAATPAA